MQMFSSAARRRRSAGCYNGDWMQIETAKGRVHALTLTYTCIPTARTACVDWYTQRLADSTRVQMVRRTNGAARRTNSTEHQPVGLYGTQLNLFCGTVRATSEARTRAVSSTAFLTSSANWSVSRTAGLDGCRRYAALTRATGTCMYGSKCDAASSSRSGRATRAAAVSWRTSQWPLGTLQTCPSVDWHDWRPSPENWNFSGGAVLRLQLERKSEWIDNLYSPVWKYTGSNENKQKNNLTKLNEIK